MRLVKLMERGGKDYREYKEALKMAKEGIAMLCELTDEMEDQYGYSSRKGYYRKDEDDWEDASEKRR